MEIAMHAIVEKVMRAFAFRHPDPDAETKRAREEATEFATELLDNYKRQLAQRARRVGCG
jgi:hypothetical protein